MAVTNGYTTTQTLAETLGINDTEDDFRLEAAINAASRQIDAHCGRRFWQDSEVKTRVYRAQDRMYVTVDDISTTAGLVVKLDEDDDGVYEITLTETTDFVLLPFNAADEVPAWPYSEVRLVDNYMFPLYQSGRPTLEVTARFGWPAVPDDVTQACIIQARNQFKAPSGTLTGYQLSVETGVAVRTPTMDPMAMALLQPYRKVLT